MHRLSALCVNYMQVTSSFDWFTGLSVSLVIGLCDLLWFWFYYAVNWNPLDSVADISHFRSFFYYYYLNVFQEIITKLSTSLSWWAHALKLLWRCSPTMYRVERHALNICKHIHFYLQNDVDITLLRGILAEKQF